MFYVEEDGEDEEEEEEEYNKEEDGESNDNNDHENLTIKITRMNMKSIERHVLAMI